MTSAVYSSAPIQFKITPEERQLLGLSEEDIASFSDEGLTPQMLQASILEIIEEAYATVPAFRQLVDMDVSRDPKRLGKSSKVVSKFLKHLRSSLPPEKGVAFGGDTFDLAHDMVQRTLQGVIQRPSAPAAVPEEKIAPITDSELSLFDLSRDKLTAKTRWLDVRDSVLYFLGRLRDAEGKLVKNESTKDMPANLRIDVLSKFFNDIREKKLSAKGGKLSPADVLFVGGSIKDLKQIAKSMVEPIPGKPDPVYTYDMMEVNSQLGDSLKILSRVQDISTDTGFTDAITEMSDALDTALPPVSLFEDRIKYIQDEVTRLGLDKKQIASVMDIDPQALSYTDSVKSLLDGYRSSLDKLSKEIADTGSTPELEKNRKVLESQIKSLEELSSKDLSGLHDAIEDYMSTLRTYKDNIDKNISGKKLGDDHQRKLEEFTRMVDQLSLVFSRLSREELLKREWSNRSGVLVRGEGGTSKQADSSTGYARRIDRFKGKGLGDAYREIQDIITDDDKLPAIKGKLVQILGLGDKIERVGQVFDSGIRGDKSLDEVKQAVAGLTRGTVYGPQILEILKKGDDLSKLKTVVQSILKKDKTVTSYATGISSEDISLGDAVKVLTRLRALVKKIKIEGKSSEALEVLEWAAMLPDHIKPAKRPAKGPKKSPKKMMEAASALRKMARLLLAEDTDTKYQNPAGVGSDLPYPSTSKAQPLLFRERMTKFGKKAMQGLFDTPDFVPDFVREMERAGLSNMLLEGGKLKEQDIDPILDTVIKKVTGKDGDLGNILMNKTMRAYRTGYDIKKVERDLDDARDRVSTLNTKITDTEEKYLPKLEEFARFAKDPIGSTRRQLEELRGKKSPGKKVPDKAPEKKVMDEVSAELVTPANFQSVLARLHGTYVGKGGMSKRSSQNIVRPETKTLPTDFVRQYQVYKKQLKNSKAIADQSEDPYKKAMAMERYYSVMSTIVDKVLGYLEYQGSVMRADAGTIKNLESFLKSDVAKKEKGTLVEGARKKLTELKESFSEQKKVFDTFKKDHSNISTVKMMTEDQLKIIREDLSDKKVEMLYQVAISPELVPDKAKAKKIKQRAKEKEKGLSFLIDRDTYKKNMYKLITYKMKRGPAVSHPGEGMKVLSPERKKGLEESLKKFEDRINRINQETDYGMRQIALEKLEQELSKAKSELAQGTKMIDDYTSLIQNIDYLAAKKNEMDPKEYAKEVGLLNSLLKEMKIYQEDSAKDVKIDKKDLKRDIKSESEYLVKVKEHIEELEGGVLDKARKELEESRPPEDIARSSELLMQRLYRIRGMDQQPRLKPRTPQEQLKVLEEKVSELKKLEQVSLKPEPGTPGDQAYRRFKRELAHSLQVAVNDLEQFSKSVPSTEVKTGAIEDTMPDLSPYEKALEVKGKKPAPYMQDLPKPKGWDIVEHFFDDIRKEQRLLREMKEKGEHSQLQSAYLKKRVDQLEGLERAIDDYKKQDVLIGGDPVAFRDIMVKFEETLSKYQDLLTKYTAQRDDAVKRVQSLKQELDYHHSLYDPETGEFKGIDAEEIENLKGIFLRMLYRDLERYWATKVGKDLSVFGERDTNWYNNVFSTFKNVADAKSNKKMLGIVNKYKQETRSDFDDMKNRMKSQELIEARDKLLKGYEEFGVDPEISSRLKTLNTRIETLKKQEAQINRVFDIMGSASLVALQSDFEKKLKERSKELAEKSKSEDKVKPSKAKLDDKAKDKAEEAVVQVTEALPVFIKNNEEVEKAEQDLKSIQKDLEKGPVQLVKPTPLDTKDEKVDRFASYGKGHRDFNLNILYGSLMQSKIAEMLDLEMSSAA